MNGLQIQGYLGLAIGAVIVLLAATETIQLYPETWDWTMAQGWYKKNFNIFATAGILYYPVIFGIQFYMKDKEAFDLGGAKTKGLINWIFWWETGLAIFSILGAYYVLPSVILTPIMEGRDWNATVCGESSPNLDEARPGFWIFIFCASKLFEFGDTLFVVLRKRNLIVLQHYHHLATMLYCWSAVIILGTDYNNATPAFACMNLCVHSIMYSWYAATRTGWRSPRVIMMAVTVLQLVQMVGGVAVVTQTIVGECRDPVTNYGMFMYISYFFLFSRLFIQNYLIPKATAACHKATSKCDKTKTKKDA